ncbi:copper chaperone CopZ [Rummeliibacillus pycnus]|uniref:copper chaperone CopZ n=1 Tax=Rummeliibacillus pycnus TaxID=101070 RepID=UPI003D27CE40
MENITLKVLGMSCGHCVKAIEGNVGTLDGIDSVRVDLADAKVDITFDKNIVSLEKIKETIIEQGYDVVE